MDETNETLFSTFQPPCRQAGAEQGTGGSQDAAARRKTVGWLSLSPFILGWVVLSIVVKPVGAAGRC
jgi:hypothetical protein